MKGSEGVHRIAVVAFEGISPFHLSVPCMVFADDLARLTAPRYALIVCAETPGRIGTTSGISLFVEHDLSALETADTVIVPAWPGPEIRPPEALLEALQRAHARGARLVGLCVGAFVLAEAGLLDGRRASTHWVFAEDFAERYPHVFLDRSVLYVDEGDVLTSAGTAAAIDCCLHLLRRDHGAETANRVARRMVVAPHRSGGQAQYIEQPLHKTLQGDLLKETLEWAAGNLSEPLCLDRLAAKAAMSRRNFSRRFRKETGTTVSQWILAQRLALVQRLLETTDRRMETIAEAAGFGSAVTMRQRFVDAFRISPVAYRRQFRTAGADERALP
ncbi:helix-turn-helix domain-containing protein [uncultured Nitratireductor sp.]|uniref:GlxA family transcriptional regulator n=1 Tax=uncultured Nitratireductor sp. TaxID=520953 RepID=UPI0026184610|nr:helix-turn-helix domain-containing protein [uncultured Nitratireductor sp.]